MLIKKTIVYAEVRSVAYKIHKCIASAAVGSLTNLNRLIVGTIPSKRSLFRGQKMSMRIIWVIIISPSFHYFGLVRLRLVILRYTQLLERASEQAFTGHLYSRV